ncbi:hypothetical protein AMTR_s00010p00266770 [Amborella trichopoda]|uniref:SUI1 domain-containing protein n=2 Tax=Amborella trichopoda TaxID=13333 RepID=W1NFF5_AMBTC|nr:hypothetical protein AMTR_s00010p00266770 [Amborella trichopoda]
MSECLCIIKSWRKLLSWEQILNSPLDQQFLDWSFIYAVPVQQGKLGEAISPCIPLSSYLLSLSFMSDLDIQVPGVFDPFADALGEDSGAGTKDYVHVRVQQRNGRKCLTTVQGVKKEFNYNKILKDFKKEFCCNGTVVQDKELGQVIQLQGDQRKNVSNFLVQAGIVKKDNIKIHGF